MFMSSQKIQAAAIEYRNEWRPLIEADEFDQPHRYALCEAICDWVERGVATGEYDYRCDFVKSLFPNFYY